VSMVALTAWALHKANDNTPKFKRAAMFST
jgi:hypothetical protein